MSKNPERDEEIVNLAKAGMLHEDIGKRYGIGAGRVGQIVFGNVQVALESWHAYRLRDEAVVGWHRTGMTCKELAARYGICRGRIHQIIQKQKMREAWQQSRKPPKRALSRKVTLVKPLAMKPGAIWHTWYLDPTRRD